MTNWHNIERSYDNLSAAFAIIEKEAQRS